ncbi:MAG TPA: hypothetical protein VL986_03960 [Terracidiphilus sp.]|nr:hypothetical protein [Terracidiphilus sp.]
MPNLLTAAATMMCPHGGMVTATPSQTNAQAGGSPILQATDTFIIAGCSFAPGGVYTPCVSVQWSMPAQHAQVGSPPLTDSSVGLCLAATQAPQGAVIIQPAQTNAQAI